MLVVAQNLWWECAEGYPCLCVLPPSRSVTPETKARGIAQLLVCLIGLIALPIAVHRRLNYQLRCCDFAGGALEMVASSEDLKVNEEALPAYFPVVVTRAENVTRQRWTLQVGRRV